MIYFYVAVVLLVITGAEVTMEASRREKELRKERSRRFLKLFKFFPDPSDRQSVGKVWKTLEKRRCLAARARKVQRFILARAIEKKLAIMQAAADECGYPRDNRRDPGFPRVGRHVDKVA
jgi:hypothetical protein